MTVKLNVSTRIQFVLHKNGVILVSMSLPGPQNLRAAALESQPRSLTCIALNFSLFLLLLTPDVFSCRRLELHSRASSCTCPQPSHPQPACDCHCACLETRGHPQQKPSTGRRHRLKHPFLHHKGIHNTKEGMISKQSCLPGVLPRSQQSAAPQNHGMG